MTQILLPALSVLTLAVVMLATGYVLGRTSRRPRRGIVR